MESSKETSFPPASDIPLHRNAPLAPSQELAYRKKCIQLKRRLAEIEANNDSTRKRITQEKDHIKKLRLLRAILLNNLQEIMSTPAKKLTPEQLEKIGVLSNGSTDLAELAGTGITQESRNPRPDGEGLLDDSTDESEEEEPEPAERPERRRRVNNNYRETIMNANAPGESASTAYQQQTLPNLAPASSFSPARPHDHTGLTSSFRVSSGTPHAAGTSSSYPPPAESSHNGGSSPIYAGDPRAVYYGPGDIKPIRPDPPYVQFTAHMTPQLAANGEHPDDIPDRIQSEWDELTPDNRKLWEVRYQEQMAEYTAAMDIYKRASRRDTSSGFAGPS
ncbi:hypothetical protein PV08_05752 [Exophiala spinifera]|uniref:HMG box domain-containing protein n=1 Tax=Exophiala spinifera TaxID=91928 RepID=A0A0D1ZSA5_9EURO|nr:uncharacterized protein PV08_05752 [Exophiala spinifera]KIW15702.1 hypothetical protein PV08_05752 [Exophiala spinifera]